MHWPELHSLLDPNSTNLSADVRRKNVIDIPHLVDWFFTKHLESFLKHWLYDTLNAEWHWNRYEFQARGSIRCHGTAKLKSDHGLCNLTEIALKGFLTEKCHSDCRDGNILHDIEQDKKASEQVCNYVESLVSTWNPPPPVSEIWTKPHIHPCKKFHEDIVDFETDYADLLNTVQRHTRCSTNYRLKRRNENKELQCRFNIPFNCCTETKLEFEPINTKDNSIQYKAKVVTKRNDPRLNNNQRVQLQSWRRNCDIQVIIDHHACVEYLCKYAAKGETRSTCLKILLTQFSLIQIQMGMPRKL